MWMWKGKNFVPKIGESISCLNLLQFHELFHAADQWKDAFLVEHINDYLGKEYTVYIDLGYLFSVQNLRSKGQRTWTWTWWSSTWTCSTRQRQLFKELYRTVQCNLFFLVRLRLHLLRLGPRGRGVLWDREGREDWGGRPPPPLAGGGRGEAPRRRRWERRKGMTRKAKDFAQRSAE